jgi:hypothetical protein
VPDGDVAVCVDDIVVVEDVVCGNELAAELRIPFGQVPLGKIPLGRKNSTAATSHIVMLNNSSADVQESSLSTARWQNC